MADAPPRSNQSRFRFSRAPAGAAPPSTESSAATAGTGSQQHTAISQQAPSPATAGRDAGQLPSHASRFAPPTSQHAVSTQPSSAATTTTATNRPLPLSQRARNSLAFSQSTNSESATGKYQPPQRRGLQVASSASASAATTTVTHSQSPAPTTRRPAYSTPVAHSRQHSTFDASYVDRADIIAELRRLSAEDDLQHRHVQFKRCVHQLKHYMQQYKANAITSPHKASTAASTSNSVSSQLISQLYKPLINTLARTLASLQPPAGHSDDTERWQCHASDTVQQLTYALKHSTVRASDVDTPSLQYVVDNVLYLLGVDARSQNAGMQAHDAGVDQQATLKPLIHSYTWLDAEQLLSLLLQQNGSRLAASHAHIIKLCQVVWTDQHIASQVSPITADSSTLEQLTASYVTLESQRLAWVVLNNCALNSPQFVQHQRLWQLLTTQLASTHQQARADERYITVLHTALRSIHTVLQELVSSDSKSKPTLEPTLNALLCNCHKLLTFNPHSTLTAQINSQHFNNESDTDSIEDVRTRLQRYEQQYASDQQTQAQTAAECRKHALQIIQQLCKHSTTILSTNLSTLLPNDTQSALSAKPFSGTSLMTVLLHDTSSSVRQAAAHTIHTCLPHTPIATFKAGRSTRKATTAVSNLSLRYVEQIRAWHTALTEAIRQAEPDAANSVYRAALYQCFAALVQYTPYSALPASNSNSPHAPHRQASNGAMQNNAVYVTPTGGMLLDALGDSVRPSAEQHAALACLNQICASQAPDIPQLVASHSAVTTLLAYARNHCSSDSPLTDANTVLCQLVQHHPAHVRSHGAQIEEQLKHRLQAIITTSDIASSTGTALKLLADCLRHSIVSLQDEGTVQWVMQIVNTLHQLATSSAASSALQTPLISCIDALLQQAQAEQYKLLSQHIDELYQIVVTSFRHPASTSSVKVESCKCLSHFAGQTPALGGVVVTALCSQLTATDKAVSLRIAAATTLLAALALTPHASDAKQHDEEEEKRDESTARQHAPTVWHQLSSEQQSKLLTQLHSPVHNDTEKVAMHAIRCLGFIASVTDGADCWLQCITFLHQQYVQHKTNAATSEQLLCNLCHALKQGVSNATISSSAEAKACVTQATLDAAFVIGSASCGYKHRIAAAQLVQQVAETACSLLQNSNSRVHAVDATTLASVLQVALQDIGSDNKLTAKEYQLQRQLREQLQVTIASLSGVTRTPS